MNRRTSTILAAALVCLPFAGCGVEDPYADRSAIADNTKPAVQSPDGPADLKRRPEGQVAARYIVAARTLAAGPQAALSDDQLNATTGRLHNQIAETGVAATRTRNERVRQIRVRAVLPQPTNTGRRGQLEVLVVCDEYDTDTGNQRTAYRVTVHRTPAGPKVTAVAAALPGEVPTGDGQWQPDGE